MILTQTLWFMYKPSFFFFIFFFLLIGSCITSFVLGKINLIFLKKLVYDIRGKWTFTLNLQTMQQNTFILKLFNKVPLFLKLNFNKIELQVELDINNVEFYEYFATQIFKK